MLLLSRSFCNICQMKRILFVLLVIAYSYSSSAQSVAFRCKNFSYAPKLDTTIDGIWMPTDTVVVDSAYIEKPSSPNYYDLGVPDLEVKFKALWHDSTVYFLFRRLDDTLVNGYLSDDSPDNTLCDSLVNRDATAIYINLKANPIIDDDYLLDRDSIAWLRFVWQSDSVEGQLPGGQIVNDLESIHSEIKQWKDDDYYWAKLAINIGKMAPHLFKYTEGADGPTYVIDSAFVPFAIELNEVDKEIEPEPYCVQTRAYWGLNVGESVFDDLSRWSFFYFLYNAFDFNSFSTYQNFNGESLIYPVPASTDFTIQLNQYDEVEYAVYNIMGEMVLTGSFEGQYHTVYIDGFSAGTYFLRLKDSSGNYITSKLLIR